MIESRRNMLAACGLAALLLFSALGMRGAVAQTLTPVTIAAVPAEELTPVMYAIKSGIFRRLGLDVQITWLTNGAAAAAAVVGGSVQFGHGAAYTIILTSSRGIPLKIIAPTSVYTPGYPFAVLVRKDSPIQTAADMSGKTLAVPSLNALDSLFIRAWLDQNGGDSKNLRFTEMPSSSFLPALDQGRVDAISFAGPLLANALDSNSVRALVRPLAAVVGKNTRFVLSTVYTTAAYAEANPRIVQAFSRGVLEGNAYANRHQADMAPITAEILKVDVATVARSQRVVFREAIDPKDLQPFVDLLNRYNVIDKPVDVMDIFAPSILNTR